MSAPRTGRGPRALSRFFARHNACGRGFDVGRPEGGLVRVTCTGCGEEFAYETAAGLLPEGSAMPAAALDPLRDAAALEPGGEIAEEPDIAEQGSGYGPGWSSRRRGFEDEGERVEVPEAASPRGARGWRPRAPMWARRPYRWPRLRLPNRWVDAVVIGAMLCAVGIIVLGVTGGDDEGSDDRASSGVEAEPSPQADDGDGGPTGEGAADDEGPAGDERRAGAESAAEEGGMAAPGDEVDLPRARTFFSAYRIAIPKSWDVTRQSPFLQFTCKDRDADVRVYYEQRSARPTEMEDELRRFLKSEHPGADIGELERTRIGGADAASLTARYGGSVETATLIAEQPYLYLVLSRVDDSASAAERAAASAALGSFRPA